MLRFFCPQCGTHHVPSCCSVANLSILSDTCQSTLPCHVNLCSVGTASTVSYPWLSLCVFVILFQYESCQTSLHRHHRCLCGCDPCAICGVPDQFAYVCAWLSSVCSMGVVRPACLVFSLFVAVALLQCGSCQTSLPCHVNVTLSLLQ